MPVNCGGIKDSLDRNIIPKRLFPRKRVLATTKNKNPRSISVPSFRVIRGQRSIAGCMSLHPHIAIEITPRMKTTNDPIVHMVPPFKVLSQCLFVSCLDYTLERKEEQEGKKKTQRIV
jgi:hypothetical protein